MAVFSKPVLNFFKDMGITVDDENEIYFLVGFVLIGLIILTLIILLIVLLIRNRRRHRRKSTTKGTEDGAEGQDYYYKIMTQMGPKVKSVSQYTGK